MLLMHQAVAADPRNEAAFDRQLAENGTDDDGVPPGDGLGFGRGDWGARRTEPQRGQRCSVQPVAAVGDDDGGGGAGGTLLEATRTVDRYRVNPVVQAYYEGPRPVVYRERPAVAVAYVRRRRPVVVVQDRPQVLLLQPKSKDVTIGSPPSYVPVPDEVHTPVLGEPLVSLTADQVRRVLQRIFSEGVLAGEAAAAAAETKFIKVRSSE